MAYINTGYKRATNIAANTIIGGMVTKTDNYSLLDAFGSFQTVTENDIATMSLNDYEARLNAKIAEINALSIYDTMVIDSIGARVHNTTDCPI